MPNLVLTESTRKTNPKNTVPQTLSFLWLCSESPSELEAQCSASLTCGRFLSFKVFLNTAPQNFAERGYVGNPHGEKVMVSHNSLAMKLITKHLGNHAPFR